MARNVELPIVQEKVGRSGLNKCRWNNEGSAILTGDSSGSMSMYILSEKHRRMDNSKYEDLTKYLVQAPETNEWLHDRLTIINITKIYHNYVFLLFFFFSDFAFLGF